jgi:two-component system phosphate regulon response regulator PhoB
VATLGLEGGGKRGEMKKILLIDHLDVDLIALLKYTLDKEGFHLIAHPTGENAVELCSRERPDVILLNITLPGADGLEICQTLRNHPELCSTPIIFITERRAQSDCIRGLEIGANDYIVKPFFVREVVARIKVQLRRPVEKSSLLRVGELELDRMRCRVWQSGKELSLTATEFRLLEYMMDRAGTVFSRQQLMNAVWANHHDVSDRSVDVYVFRLRRKLGADPQNSPVIRFPARLWIHF